jgi:glycosyltransferase involved in cell wall biosynthesis
MKILVDLQGAQNESRHRGIGRYALAFVRALIRNKGTNEIVVLLSDLFPESLAYAQDALGEQRAHCTIKIWSGIGPTDLRKPENHWRKDVSELLREAFIADLNPDVLIISSLLDSPGDNTIVSVSKLAPVYTVAMLYDLIPLLYKSEYLVDPTTQDWYYERLWQFKKADFWFAISESSRNDGIAQLGLPAAQVHNISAALGEDIVAVDLNAEQAAALKQKFGITRPFLLYSGAFDPRKNIDRLVHAYAAQPAEIRQTHQLVLAGGLNAPQLVHVNQLISQAGLDASQVIVTQRITDHELCALYGLCKAYILPTYCEGFGFTALEAMACGAPTIGSNYSSVPEVIGLPEALFDPFSVESIASKITQVLSDEAYRAMLVAHGPKQVQTFSWDHTARKALEALERLERDGVLGAKARSVVQPIAALELSTVSQTSAPLSAHSRPQTKPPTAVALVTEITVRIAAFAQTSQRPAVELQETAALVAGLLPRQDTRPRLFVDITELHATDSKSGIQRVVRSVIQHLLTDADAAHKVELVYAAKPLGYKTATAFTRRMFGDGQLLNLTNTEHGAKSSEGSDALSGNASISQDAHIHPQKGDIFLGLDLHFNIDQDHEHFFNKARQAGAQVYFVVYDLLPLLLKDTFTSELVEKYGNWLRVVSQQHGAVCISQAVAAELTAWVAQNQPAVAKTFKIDWFHLGADIESSIPSKGVPDDGAQLLQQLAAQPSFLAVGTLEPRKRHGQMLDAFDLLWAQNVAANLIIVGKPGWLTEALTTWLSTHPQLGRQLFWVQTASDEYLEKIYAVASCLIAASEAEGFGLPLIEAARHGLPIIARDIPVFREVAKEHAFYFAGDDGAALATAIQSWLALSKQQKIPNSRQIQRQTWGQSTQQLLSRVLSSKDVTKIA